MRTLTLRLIGTSPLLLHRISKHQLREQIAACAGGGRSLQDEAEDVMSKDSHGNPAVPPSWLWDAIRVGCSRITVEQGRQLSFTKISSALHLPAGFIKVRDTDNRTPVWTAYSSVQHSAHGSKRFIAVVAPEFKDWMLSVLVWVNGHFPDDGLLLKIFTEAGRVGVGLFHPPKKHFGQFRVAVLPSVVW